MSDETKTALVTVSDKRRLLWLAEELSNQGVHIVSTGGTYGEIKKAGFPVSEVEEYTGTGELLGGLIKTLHHRIYLGVMADSRDEDHRKDLEAESVRPFDLVAVNVYQLAEELEKFKRGKSDKTMDQLARMIDIGGVSLIRALFKMIVLTEGEFPGILVSRPEQYKIALDILFGRVPSLEWAAVKRFLLARDANDTVMSHVMAGDELVRMLVDTW